MCVKQLLTARTMHGISASAFLIAVWLTKHNTEMNRKSTACYSQSFSHSVDAKHRGGAANHSNAAVVKNVEYWRVISL